MANEKTCKTAKAMRVSPKKPSYQRIYRCEKTPNWPPCLLRCVRSSFFVPAGAKVKCPTSPAFFQLARSLAGKQKTHNDGTCRFKQCARKQWLPRVDVMISQPRNHRSAIGCLPFVVPKTQLGTSRAYYYTLIGNLAKTKNPYQRRDSTGYRNCTKNDLNHVWR